MTARAAVAVVGPGDATDDDLLHGAERIGALLAAAGVVVFTGGHGGVMAAASRGAADAGGLVVGILPGDDATAANEWVAVAVPTGMGEARNALVARSAAAVIAVGGSWGTLSEVALARRNGTPVFCWRGWHVDEASDLVHVASPDEAVSAALAAIHPR